MEDGELRMKEKDSNLCLKVIRKRSTITVKCTSIGPKIGGWDLRWLGWRQSSHGLYVFNLFLIGSY